MQIKRIDTRFRYLVFRDSFIPQYTVNGVQWLYYWHYTLSQESTIVEFDTEDAILDFFGI